MFQGAKIRQLEARLDQLEAQLDTRVGEAGDALRAEVRQAMDEALARIEADPSRRLGLLVEGVEAALGERVAALEPRLGHAETVLGRLETAAAPLRDEARMDVPFCELVTAPCTGLLSLWQDFGASNDEVKVVLVTDETETVVGWVNAGRGLNGSFAAVIRAGERYRLDSAAVKARSETGIRACFTPFGP